MVWLTLSGLKNYQIKWSEESALNLTVDFFLSYRLLLPMGDPAKSKSRQRSF